METKDNQQEPTTPRRLLMPFHFVLIEKKREQRKINRGLMNENKIKSTGTNNTHKTVIGAFSFRLN